MKGRLQELIIKSVEFVANEITKHSIYQSLLSKDFECFVADLRDPTQEASAEYLEELCEIVIMPGKLFYSHDILLFNAMFILSELAGRSESLVIAKQNVIEFLSDDHSEYVSSKFADIKITEEIISDVTCSEVITAMHDVTLSAAESVVALAGVGVGGGVNGGEGSGAGGWA